MRGRVFEEWDMFSQQNHARLLRELEMEAERRGLMIREVEEEYLRTKVAKAWKASKPGSIYLRNGEGLFNMWLYPSEHSWNYVTDAADACEYLLGGKAWEIGAVLAGKLARELDR